MPPRKPTKRSKSKSSSSSRPLTIVYVVGTFLTLGFLWVTWPFISEMMPASDQDKQVQKLEQEHPDAEVFNLPNHDVKKNP